MKLGSRRHLALANPRLLHNQAVVARNFPSFVSPLLSIVNGAHRAACSRVAQSGQDFFELGVRFADKKRANDAEATGRAADLGLLGHDGLGLARLFDLALRTLGLGGRGRLLLARSSLFIVFQLLVQIKRARRLSGLDPIARSKGSTPHATTPGVSSTKQKNTPPFASVAPAHTSVPRCAPQQHVAVANEASTSPPSAQRVCRRWTELKSVKRAESERDIEGRMSWRADIGRNVQQLRFFLDKNNPRADGLRRFVENNYRELKARRREEGFCA